LPWPAGWLERHQQAIIDYLIEENRILKEQLEGQRFRFTDEQRIRLAVKAKAPGRRLPDELEMLVTSDTLVIDRVVINTDGDCPVEAELFQIGTWCFGISFTMTV